MAQKIEFWGDRLIAAVFFVLTAGAIYLQLDRGLWRDHLYYDGDNITLALALKSWFEGEPFHWVFSSQTFLFPEVPLYLASYGLTHDFAHALLVNALLNFGIVVLFVWLISQTLSPLMPKRNLAIALFCALTMWVLSLEFYPNVNAHTIFSLIFLSTYYAGVILVALLQLWMLTHFADPPKGVPVVYQVLFILIGGLCYSSDPLYLLQFLAPMFALGILLLGSKLSKQFGWRLLCLLLLTGITGVVLRQICQPFFSAGVGNYINIAQSFNALMNLVQLIASSITSPAYAALWTSWLLLYGFNVIYFWRLLREPKMAPSKNEMLVYGYCLLAPLATIAGVVVTGNIYTRYLLPVPIFILIGSALTIVRLCSRKQLYLLCSVLMVLGTGCWLFQFLKNQAVIDSHAQDIACYEHHVARYELHPVGGYWDVRYLNLFTNQQQAYQITNDFHPLNWLSNVVDHRDSQINTVIVSHGIEPNHIHVSDLEVLGDFSAKYECAQFDLYVYDKGTKAYAILNQRIGQ